MSIFSTKIKGSIYRTNEMHFEGFLFQTFQEIICLENKMREKDLKPPSLDLGRMQQGNNRWAKEFVNLSLGQ